MTRTTFQLHVQEAQTGHGANWARFFVLIAVFVGVVAVRQLIGVWPAKHAERSTPPNGSDPTCEGGR